jgi:predicted phosphodiesterase
MRLAILADIHGNLPALEAVLADAAQLNVDRILVAGDVVDGPYPLETLQALLARRSWMIQGNREKYFLAYDRGNVPAAWHTGDRYASVRWIYRRLDRDALDLVASLPVQGTFDPGDAAAIHVVHGAPQGVSMLLLPDRAPDLMRLFDKVGLTDLGYRHVTLEEALAQSGESVLICGHSHIPWQQRWDGRLVLNPGSVGAPLNGDVRAQYALLTWQSGCWQAEHRAIGYDLDRIRAAYRDSGLLAEGGAFARAWLLTIETAHNVSGRLVAHFSRLAAQAGFEDWATIPEAIWSQAEATFDWEACCEGRSPNREETI